MIIYVIRHTPVDVPSGTCYGFSDVSLSDDWRDHAARMKRNIPLEAITPVNVYTSPLSRCSLLSRELTDTPREDDRLKEMNYGSWEGRLWCDIGRVKIDAWLADLEHYVTPNGESLGNVHQRGVSFMNELQEESHDTAFVVTHGGMVRCLVAQIIGLELAYAARLSIDYASVTRIKLDGDVRRLESMNV